MTRSRRCALAAVGMLALALPARAVRADDPTDARHLFDRAMEALADGLSAEGRDLLRRSLALDGRIPTAFNLATAELDAGEAVAALLLLESLEAGVFDEMTPEQEEAVAERTREAAARVATLRISVSGPDAATVRVDDAEPQAARGPLTIRVNPGTHLVTGEASGHATVRQAVTVQPGESTEVRLELRADAPEPATIARASRSGGSARPFTADDESSGPSAWTSPWLWIGVGAVVAGAVIAIVLAVASGGSSELVRGNFAPEARAVR